MRRLLLPCAAIALLALNACSDSSDTEIGGADPVAYDPHPEPPTILRDVSMVGDDNTWNNPFVPGHRTSADGRVAIRVQGGPPGGERLATHLSFFLFVPERLQEPIMPGPAGTEILADPTPFDVAFPPALDPTVTTLGHHAICDATEEFARQGENTNPYPCAHEPAHDCYDLTIVSTTVVGITAQLWGTPIVIEVAEPKTPTAHIVRADLGDPIAGTTIPFSPELTEPAVTTDGRLLTGRLGRLEREWTNPNTGETLRRAYDLAYSVLPEVAAPCDVTGWSEFHPMSHAPFDPQMQGRYGLAAYPFRDTEGNAIRDGEDLGGTYPWVDREGANVFMAGVVGRISEQSEELYPRRCVVEGCEAYEENRDWDRGFMVAGHWTHGKFVHLDGLINNQDWTVGVAPQTHWLVDLYREADGSPVAVRFGAGRFIDRLRGGVFPPGYTQNPNILDSLQNVLNHTTAARTVTPRDVVWLMSTGVASEEIAFDDFLDPEAFIVSNMQASITQYYDESGASLSIPRHWNGQVRHFEAPITVIQLSIVPARLDLDAVTEIHLQNAATSLTLDVPPYGLVEAGTGRVEPVALGGVFGRGFWLSGENRIRYAIPPQPTAISERDRYVGLFVDPRTTEGASRALLTFPDGTSVRLVDRSLVQYAVGGRVVHHVELPTVSDWLHIGLRVLDRGRRIILLINGFALDRHDFDDSLFQLHEGELIVGRAQPDDAGVRGWIDDFKVLIHDLNPEVACNHARGTLIEARDNPTWAAAASHYPAWAHQDVAEHAGTERDGNYACFHDYSSDYAAHLGNIPSGTTSLREAINFPEGPIRGGAPRPDSSQNAFCLSCHSDAGIAGLNTAALEFRPEIDAEDDSRRQPLQPLRRVFGNIPAGWISSGDGPGGPTEATRAPPQGLVIDPWILPDSD